MAVDTTPLGLVLAERERQNQMYADGALRWIASDPDCPNELRLAALMEEVGEVARAYHDGAENMHIELTHVAAVAIAWMEGTWQ